MPWMAPQTRHPVGSLRARDFIAFTPRAYQRIGSAQSPPSSQTFLRVKVMGGLPSKPQRTAAGVNTTTQRKKMNYHLAGISGRARILPTDNMAVRADMTASWLAQMGWETYVLDGGYDRALEVGPPEVLPKPDPSHRYRRPYEGTNVGASAMQAYLDWEYGLVEQLRRDATHGFFVI